MNIKQAMSVALLLAASGSAMAQSGSAFEKPLGGGSGGVAVGGGSSGGTSTTVMRSSDGDDTYEITIKGDTIKVKQNGKEVPADRVRRDGDKIEILDKDGDVAKSFSVPSTTSGGWTAIGGGPRTVTRFGAQPPEAPEPPMPPAKVMIGINMSEPGEALLEHLGLEVGSCVQVDRVVEGLPASKAGLKVKDLVVAVDGKRPVTPDSLRESLNEKDPGDKVELTVLRKGVEKTIKVELAAFDAEKLQMPMTTEPDEATKEKAAAHDQMRDAEQKLQDAMKNLQMRQGGQGRSLWVTPREGQPMYFEAQGQDMEKKLGNIEKRLGDLSRQLERLGEQMERLTERLESQGGRRRPE
ncbi:MAG: PDZ domain-containing protein [Phycisphaerales bacterium]